MCTYHLLKATSQSKFCILPIFPLVSEPEAQKKSGCILPYPIARPLQKPPLHFLAILKVLKNN